MRRSLYWKICLTFLVVVFTAVLAGSTVFTFASKRLLAPMHRDAAIALARVSAREVERWVAAGRPPAGLTAHLEETFHELPMVTVLYRTPTGQVSGKEETNRPELREILEDAAKTGLPGGVRVDFLGPGRGAAVVLAIGPNGRDGLALVSGRALIEDIAPAVLRAAMASLLAVFIVAAVLGLLVFRAIAGRLGRVRQCLMGVVRGDLSLRVNDTGADEIADLGVSFDRMAERLQQSVQELASIDERRRRFFADVSHELKTPLTALRGHLERLLPAPDAPEAPRGPLHVAYEEVDRLFLLIEDLLELARMDATDFRLKKEETVLQRIATRAIDRFKVALDNRGIRVQTRFSPEPIRREVDARRLEQVVSNLMQNAIHSMPDGGQLELVAEERAGRAVLEIADDGPGIPADERARVFDRFYSGSGGSGGGTGLGLSIVKRLVEAHGGTVRFEDGLGGRGTRAVVEV